MSRVMYIVSPKAYGKIVYHCAKYPHRAVNGVILGTFSKKDNCTMVQDTIPLFHNDLDLSIMLEVALSQVEIYATSKGLSIVGCYIANETLQESSHKPSDLVKCIGNKIHSTTTQSCIIMVENSNIFSSSISSSFKIYTRPEQSDNWSEYKQSLSLSDDENDAIVKGIKSGVHTLLVDFDSHLDNVDQDWTNPKINAIIDKTNL